MRRTAHYADLEMKKYKLRRLGNEEIPNINEKRSYPIYERKPATRISEAD